MATAHELPEEVNEERLRTLGMEVEMKTFKTNVTKDFQRMVKILCVGDTAPRRKGMFISDYCRKYRAEGEYWSPLIGVDCQVKVEQKQKREDEERLLIILQLWEFGEHENFMRAMRGYYKGGDGAMALWRAQSPSSLERATNWMQDVKKYLPSIPWVLVTDNTFLTFQNEPLQWIGPGKIFENEAALDQFCKDHGFVDHFEIKSRDWESGEKSVFGQAVNCLLDEILQNEHKETSVIR